MTDLDSDPSTPTGTPSPAVPPTAAPAADSESAASQPSSGPEAPQPDERQQALGSWDIDVVHSEVEFTVRHLMSRVRGSFTDFSGAVTVPSTDFTQAGVEATIQLGSLTTHNEQRDAHLKSTDFFKAQSTTITFRSTEVVPASRAKHQRSDSGPEYVIIGDLTVNQVTRQIEMPAEFLGVAVDAFGVTRLGVEASAQISKKEFGVDFNIPLDGDKVLIGDRIVIDLVIQAVKR